MYHEPGPYHIETFTSRNVLLMQRHWWRVVSSVNGQTILTSEMYRNREFRDHIARRFAEHARLTIR